MEILWLSISKLKYDDFFKDITKLDKQNIIFTPNPEIVLKSKKDNEFMDILKQANYLLPDWIWLYLWAQILEEKNIFFRVLKLPIFIINLFINRQKLYDKYWEKICWSDFTKDLLDFACDKNIKITIIDLYNPWDTLKVNSQKVFSEILQKKYPKLKFDYIIYDQTKKSEIIEKIKTSDSKILFSTLWMKSQEKSVLEIMGECSNIKIWTWVWSSFDYIIWFQKRAPLFFRKLGFEWFYRIFTWPNKFKRLKRIKTAVFDFTLTVISHK